VVTFSNCSIFKNWWVFVSEHTKEVNMTGATSGAGTVHFSGASEFAPGFYSRVRVTRSLVSHVCFVDRFLFFCTFSFDHCVVCSSIYRFWLPLWYLQTLLKHDSQMTGYACRISTLVLIIHKCIITLFRNCNFQC
jgi:hypothetical protein